ncbi:hypothetical protein DO97_11800, partial [Neosynechococcus sphagnicola sy1]
MRQGGGSAVASNICGSVGSAPVASGDRVRVRITEGAGLSGEVRLGFEVGVGVGAGVSWMVWGGSGVVVRGGNIPVAAGATKGGGAGSAPGGGMGIEFNVTGNGCPWGCSGGKDGKKEVG